MKERGSCSAGGGRGEGRPRGQTELDVLLRGRVMGVAECCVRTGAFEETVRGKAVAEDAHDCFKVPLYIANESGSRPRQVSQHCACFHM